MQSEKIILLAATNVELKGEEMDQLSFAAIDVVLQRKDSISKHLTQANARGVPIEFATLALPQGLSHDAVKALSEQAVIEEYGDEIPRVHCSQKVQLGEDPIHLSVWLLMPGIKDPGPGLLPWESAIDGGHKVNNKSRFWFLLAALTLLSLDSALLFGWFNPEDWFLAMTSAVALLSSVSLYIWRSAFHFSKPLGALIAVTGLASCIGLLWL